MPKEPAKERSAEYRAFEEFTRKLVRVPKREIDAERAKSNGNGKKPKT